MKDSDNISKITDILQKFVKLPAHSKKSMGEIVENFKGVFPSVLALGTFTKTEDWSAWKKQHNIPPVIIGCIEDIFKKMEESEEEQKG